MLWEKFDEFDRNGSFKSWACGIARFRVLAWLRDKGRDRLVLDSGVVELIAEESLQAESMLEQQRDALEKCFDKIPVAQRELLSRAYHRNARIQDVAKMSGRTLSGFYQWLHRMRKRLLECISRELAKETLS